MLRYAALVAALCLPATVLAQTVPATLRAAILLRSLQYEKSFVTGAGEATLLVLGGAKGDKDASEVLAPMKQLAGSNAAGRGLKIERAAGDGTADEVQKRAATVVYVATGGEHVLAELAPLKGVVILCGDPAFVGKGCLLSVESAGSTSRLVIDVAGAEKAGLRFDARMLRLARVIR
jgi:hypothetical protein